ncbi:hypothetical protein [Methylobacterium soli]|uniref:Uncharacterized protein n=1 Tax=Methylobacterium soli TaxID=553447 RepID=A0A6L3SRK2_9HYPH|nr:hypothetical protein [Methylobacterium soli]KAB1075394.1 hypothetical protein F6X53_24810 [Methylobacterium soli]GJE43781.1 hypothetical protein AEGHOMDF_2960 [Methylobacterium soli]
MARAKPQAEPDRALERIRTRARNEGLEIAYEGAIAVCKDPKARPADRLGAANLIFRLSGAYEVAGQEDAGTKALSSLSRAELIAAADAARAYLAELDAAEDEPEAPSGSDVFD